MEEIASRPESAPVLEEKSFTGALLGFRRKEVLDYIRKMSEENDAYLNTLNSSIAQLNEKLTMSEAAGKQLQAQVAALKDKATTDEAEQERLRGELDKAMRAFKECREKLFTREQKYAVLQRECEELRAKNAEISAKIEKAKELLYRQRDYVENENAKKDEQFNKLRREYADELSSLRADNEELRKQNAAAGQKNDSSAPAGGFSKPSSSPEYDASRQRVRLYRELEQINTRLAELGHEMETVQQQIKYAFELVANTTRQLNDSLRAMGGNIVIPQPEAAEKAVVTPPVVADAAPVQQTTFEPTPAPAPTNSHVSQPAASTSAAYGVSRPAASETTQQVVQPTPATIQEPQTSEKQQPDAVAIHSVRPQPRPDLAASYAGAPARPEHGNKVLTVRSVVRDPGTVVHEAGSNPAIFARRMPEQPAEGKAQKIIIHPVNGKRTKSDDLLDKLSGMRGGK